MTSLRPNDVKTAISLVAPELRDYLLSYYDSLGGPWFTKFAGVSMMASNKDEEDKNNDIDDSGDADSCDQVEETPVAASSSSSGVQAKKLLVFPVGRLKYWCNQKLPSMRIYSSAVLLIATSMQAIAELVLSKAYEAGVAAHRMRIIPRHILIAIRGHPHLSFLFRNSMIPFAGITPEMLGQANNDLNNLLPKKDEDDSSESDGD